MPDTLKLYPFEHHRLNIPDINFEGGVYSYREKIMAECVNMQEDAIVRAVIRAAMDEGVTDLYLLDKKFVIDALVTAIEAWKRRVGHEPAGECAEHNRAERGSWCGEEGEKG